MTNSVQQVLASFDRLSSTEKIETAKEIGKRIKQEHGADGGVIDSDELIYLTDQMFQMYDAEEEHNGSAGSASW